MEAEPDIRYLQTADVIALHEVAMTASGSQFEPLVRSEDLERAVHHPKSLAFYQGAGVAEQAVDLAIEIARAHAWVDGNKRTALLTMVVFLGLNGVPNVSRDEFLGAAEELVAIVAATEDERPALTATMVHRIKRWEAGSS